MINNFVLLAQLSPCTRASKRHIYYVDIISNFVQIINKFKEPLPVSSNGLLASEAWLLIITDEAYAKDSQPKGTVINYH